MRYAGEGVVFREAESLARVRYELARTNHYLALDHDTRVEGMRVIYGEVQVIEGTI